MHAHIALGELHERVAEALGVRRASCLAVGRFAVCFGLDLGASCTRCSRCRSTFDSMHTLGVRGCFGVALALLGQQVQQHHTFQAFGSFQVFDDQVHIMTIERPHVGHAQLFEHMTGNHRVPHDLTKLIQRLIHLGTNHWDRMDEVRHLVMRALHDAVRANLRQVARQRTHRLADRPLIVVQHHDHALARSSRVVQRFEGNTCAERCVTDHRDHMRTLLGALRLLARGHR